ncbi:hypothetical protein [uncultured Ferrimonas sp.]|uniref:hypothetical protein n=1 Tax=uncultured Ferrimonas sp. TaxID=432640 RepID=UPI00261D30ED|nr:hypothetical protein [uncultured Ferrimonas sp.]
MSAHQNQGLDQVLSPQQGQGKFSASTLLFIGQQLLMILLVLTLSESMLYINQQDIKQKLANQRFSALQGFSDRINDALQQQQLNAVTLNQFTLLPSLFEQDDQQLSNTRNTLSQLQQRIGSYSDIALLDRDANVLVQVGRDKQLQVSKRELQTAISELDPDEVHLSPILLDGSNGEAHIWTLTQVQPNQRGIAYLLTNVELSTLWASLYTVSSVANPPLFLVNQQGQYISLTDVEKRGKAPLEQLYPGFWQYMLKEGFGQYDDDSVSTVFMKVRPSNRDSVYLFSFIDSEKDMAVEKRYRWQIRAITAIVLVFIFIYFWQQRRQLSDRQTRQRASALAEQLYQSNMGAMLFNLDGYCISANKQLTSQLGIPATQLQERRFNRLFSSDMLGIDVVWQLTRSSGYWEGTLLLTQPMDSQLRVNLRTITLERGESLVLLRLEESPQQREQALKLRHFEQLCDSASGIALLDANQQIISTNRAMVTVCKTQMAQLTGRSWLTLLPLNNPEMNQILDTQLSSRGIWQSQIWIRRGDAAICRCLASIQLSESSSSEDSYRVLTLTPINDLSLCNDDDLNQQFKRGNLGQLLRKNPQQQHALMVISIGNDSSISSFADADQTLFRQHMILQQLGGALPPEAVVGNLSHPSEIQILLPKWHHTQAAHLAANLLKLLDDADMSQQITIGLAQSDIDTNWIQLVEEAQAALERARMTGQRYCQAYTRLPKEPR